MALCIETIFSTLDEAGKPNFAPMGIVWNEESLTVRPFRSSQTCRNLLSSGYGVANLSDDVLAYVQCGLYDAVLPSFPSRSVPGVVFQRTCSWRELAVISHGGSSDRAEVRCRVVHEERQKDFLGFCRAGSAVLEAAILATRVAMCDPKTVAEKLTQFEEIVEKTGGHNERQAFQLVREYIRRRGIDD
jgi:uncharacterized protein